MKRLMAALTVLGLLTSCAPSDAVIMTAIAKTHAAEPTSTPLPTKPPTSTSSPTVTFTLTPSSTPTNTNTPLPTNTPTITNTPTNTPTITPTPTPISLYNAAKSWIDVKEILDNPNENEGKLISGYLEKSNSVYVGGKETDSYYLVFPLEQKLHHVVVEKGISTDETIPESIPDYSFVYAFSDRIINYKYSTGSYSNEYSMTVIKLVHMNEIDINKWPKDDGLFEVGNGIAPGRWYSSYSMTDYGCYWARINSSGNIIQNHFGVAGINVYVSPSDAVIQFDDCGTMYYIEN